MSPATGLIHLLTRPTISRRAQFVLLLVLVMAAGSIRAFLFSGYVGLDDAEYGRFAYLLAHGRPFPADYGGPGVFPLRVGVYAPAALIYRLFGVSEWTMVLYPFLASLAAIVLLYFCAAFYFGWQAGLVAAALLSAFFLDIDNATMLLPDLPAALFAAAAVSLVAVLERRMTTGASSRVWGGVLAGFLFGLSWLCKESVVYLVPFCLLLMWITIRRHGTRAAYLWAGVAAGSLAILITEMTVHWSTSGDLLLRLHEVERNYKQWENGFFTAGSNLGWSTGTSYRDALIDRLFVSGPRKILLDGSLYFVPLIGLAGAVYGWARRDGSFLIPGLWLASLVLMFNFASSSLTSYIPLPLYYRYMYLMYFPAFVIVSGLLTKTLLPVLTAEAWSLSARRGGMLLRAAGGLTAAGFILWAAALNLYYGARSPSTWTSEVRALREMGKPDSEIYADALTLRAFEFFAGYPRQTAWRGFEHLSSSDDISPGSLVIVNKQYIAWLDRNAGMWVTWPGPGQTDRSGYRKYAFYDHAPPTWTEVRKNNNTRVYRVAALPAKQGVSRDGD